MSKHYNIYYKGEKINKTPLDGEHMKKIDEEKFIYKKVNDSTFKIPVDKTRKIKCTLI